MEHYNNTENRAASIALRAAFLVIGLISIPVAIVWLPIFGLFFSALLIGFSLSPNLFAPHKGSIRVLVGSRTREYLKANQLIPISILSTQQQSVVDGYSASAVIPDSVRLEHNDGKPVYGPNTQGSPAAYVSKMNGSVDSEMVFYFSEEDFDETGKEDVCVIAKTMDGNSVRGCAHLESAV
jgi:hypothetical protein